MSLFVVNQEKLYVHFHLVLVNIFPLHEIWLGTSLDLTLCLILHLHVSDIHLKCYENLHCKVQFLDNTTRRGLCLTFTQCGKSFSHLFNTKPLLLWRAQKPFTLPFVNTFSLFRSFLFSRLTRLGQFLCFVFIRRNSWLGRVNTLVCWIT